MAADSKEDLARSLRGNNISNESKPCSNCLEKITVLFGFFSVLQNVLQILHPPTLEVS